MLGCRRPQNVAPLWGETAGGCWETAADRGRPSTQFVGVLVVIAIVAIVAFAT